MAKHALLTIGNTLKINSLMQEYIKRTYIKHFNELGAPLFTPRSNPNLPFFLEELIKKNDILTIVAPQDSFSLVGKILTTLNEDVLVVKEETLTPSKAKIAKKNSYLVEIQECQVNVLHVEENREIPELLSKVKLPSKQSFHVVGLDSEALKILLEPLMQTFEVAVATSSYVDGWIRVEATSNRYGNVDNFIKSVYELFRGKIFLGSNPMEHIVQSLEKSGKTISVAESCTGGLISAYLTSAQGASAVLEGTLTTYSNRIKTAWLGVDEEVVKSYGAVSEETVRGMLEGCLKASDAHIAMATSGIAGPDGGSVSKPVGTVFVGVANRDGNFMVERLLLQGDRKFIQAQSAYFAFKLLFELEREAFF